MVFTHFLLHHLRFFAFSHKYVCLVISSLSNDFKYSALATDRPNSHDYCMYVGLSDK